MSNRVLIYRARWSFLERSESLMEAGRIMAAWSEEAAGCMAPALEWTAVVVEHADYGLKEEWQAAHVVELVGNPSPDATGGPLSGRGRSRLAVGGRGQRIGGTGRIRVETLGGYGRLEVDNHCDVTHWDIDLGPVGEPQIFALQSSLERVLGADIEITGERREPVDFEPVLIAREPSDEDLALWTEDLTGAGFEVKVEDRALYIEQSAIETFDAVDAALVTLGEVLAEAGESDWERRALDVLRSVPHREPDR